MEEQFELLCCYLFTSCSHGLIADSLSFTFIICKVRRAIPVTAMCSVEVVFFIHAGSPHAEGNLKLSITLRSFKMFNTYSLMYSVYWCVHV